MFKWLKILLDALRTTVRSRHELVLENFSLRQPLVEACGAAETPKHLIRDRDAIYGNRFQRQTKALSIEEVITAPASPWHYAFAERVIGPIRRECPDHVIVLGERQFKRILLH